MVQPVYWHSDGQCFFPLETILRPCLPVIQERPTLVAPARCPTLSRTSRKQMDILPRAIVCRLYCEIDCIQTRGECRTMPFGPGVDDEVRGALRVRENARPASSHIELILIQQ